MGAERAVRRVKVRVAAAIMDGRQSSNGGRVSDGVAGYIVDGAKAGRRKCGKDAQISKCCKAE